MAFDLLSTVEQGGCSAKLDPKLLDEIMSRLVTVCDPRLLVGTETHDDAAVWKISDDTAIVQTTDFFPPVCSDPRDFGRIAAANALSDVYAMGARPLLALNIVMFPSAKLGPDALSEMLQGGAEKIAEAGVVLAGGHTIDDAVPKYGLSVMGVIHPEHIWTNSRASAGDVLILTKPLGTGVVLAGRKLGLARDDEYGAALESMRTLNRRAADVATRYHLRAATDVTGFGLVGHALKMAKGSGVAIKLSTRNLPTITGATRLAETGCIPGAAFRNLRYVESETHFSENVVYEKKMLICDAQTSGGLLLCCPRDKKDSLLNDLKAEGCSESTIVGEVLPRGDKERYLFIE